MTDRRTVDANRPWARVAGYARAVRVGDVVEVSGTASADAEGTILHPGDVYAQAAECLRIIDGALRELGGSLRDVVRTRVFLADPSRWQEAGRAHGEAFAAAPPATTFVAAGGFIDPEILVEIEASAIVRPAAG
jgi:enamine deaminase RidA (YjgF/YER057c/UK114 family)